MFTKPKQHVIEIIYGRGMFVGDFNILIKGCGLKIYRICPIRIEIIYGRGKNFTQIMLPILKSPTNLPLP